MNRLSLAALVLLVALGVLLLTGFDTEQAFWSQWGQNPQHRAWSALPANPSTKNLPTSSTTLCPAGTNRDAGGELLAHYQSTLIDRQQLLHDAEERPLSFLPAAGTWVYGFPCGPNAWNRIQWKVVRRDWQGNKPVSSGRFPPIGSRSRMPRISCWDMVAWKAGSRSFIPLWQTDSSMFPARRARYGK